MALGFHPAWSNFRLSIFAIRRTASVKLPLVTVFSFASPSVAWPFLLVALEEAVSYVRDAMVACPVPAVQVSVLELLVDLLESSNEATAWPLESQKASFCTKIAV